MNELLGGKLSGDVASPRCSSQLPRRPATRRDRVVHRDHPVRNRARPLSALDDHLASRHARREAAVLLVEAFACASWKSPTAGVSKRHTRAPACCVRDAGRSGRKPSGAGRACEGTQIGRRTSPPTTTATSVRGHRAVGVFSDRTETSVRRRDLVGLCRRVSRHEWPVSRSVGRAGSMFQVGLVSVSESINTLERQASRQRVGPCAD